MPFPLFIFLTQTYIKIRHTYFNKRKEEGFDFSHIFKSSCKAEKVSESASLRASVTVEAVVCIPLFFYAAVCLIWLLEIRTIQIDIRCGLQSTGREIAENAFEYSFLNPSKVKQLLVNSVGRERLTRSIIVDGVEGIRCDKSFVMPMSSIYELKAEYYVKLPFPFFKMEKMKYEESMRVKGWTGYVKELYQSDDPLKTVYITETGLVYHLDYHCHYLEPSIKTVGVNDVAGLRNESGEKYVRCPLCGKSISTQSTVYITDYGNRYHNSISCSGLKRSIYAIPISEVKGRRACSKCGK